MVEHFLGRIESLNPALNAVVTVTSERALDDASAMDQGTLEPGLLWGLPFLDKDLSHRAGVRTGFGSRIFDQAEPASSSDPIPRALDAAGGISLGKSAVCEFGFASYTESLVFPPTKSPWGTDLGAGGSSGGAAAAVASGMVPFAPGSDGGGSVRIPAWACGVVGLKPSRGLIPGGTGFESIGGLVVPGPLARSVQDAALLLDALRGHGETHRATQPPATHSSFLSDLDRPLQPLRIGVTTSSPWDDWTDIALSPPSVSALERVVRELEHAGHQVERWGWKPPGGYADAFHTVWTASAVALEISHEDLGLTTPLTRYLVEKGAALGARDLVVALRTLSAFERAVIEEFSAFDLVLTPGLATLPPKTGFYDLHDAERNFVQQVQVTPFTSFVNVCGLPALALPVGATEDGIPLGVQLIGRPGSDSLLLQVGHQLEQVLGWQHQRPPVW